MRQDKTLVSDVNILILNGGGLTKSAATRKHPPQLNFNNVSPANPLFKPTEFELGEYIRANVQKLSVVVNRKPQTPTVIPSANAGDWMSKKLK